MASRFIAPKWLAVCIRMKKSRDKRENKMQQIYLDRARKR